MARRPTSERQRGTYIGGPDAAAIVGANRYATAADVYSRIVHGYRPERNAKMLRGHIIEPGLLDYAAEWRGKQVFRDCFFVDDRVPFFRCSVDGTEPDIDAPDVIHETKTWRPSAWGIEHDEKWGPTDSDDIEPAAAAQCQWEMGITGAREAHVWCYLLDEDSEPRHYVLHRDPRRIRELRDAAEQFWWDHVVPKVPPPVAPYDDDAARAMYPTSVKDAKIEPTGEILMAAMQYAAARTLRDQAVAAMSSAGAVLKNALGSAEKCSWDGVHGLRPKGAVSWKSAQMTEPVTAWETVAHELAQRFKVPGHVFHGLVQENTRRPYTARQLRVTITMPKQKAK